MCLLETKHAMRISLSWHKDMAPVSRKELELHAYSWIKKNHIVVNMYIIKSLQVLAIHALLLTEFFYPHSGLLCLSYILLVPSIMISLVCTGVGIDSNHPMTSDSHAFGPSYHVNEHTCTYTNSIDLM